MTGGDPYNPDALKRVGGAIEELGAVMRRFSQALERDIRRSQWDLRIAFAETEKQRRRLRRDRAREYRRPAIIHNGGKR